MGTHPIFESDFDCLTVWTLIASNVMWARKKFNVKYPSLYSDKSAVFNCYQRAHQNTLEYFLFVLVQFVPCAVFDPKLASIFFSIWITSRFFYATGYYTGDPEKRMRGVFGYLGFFGMFFYNLYIAYTLLTST